MKKLLSVLLCITVVLVASAFANAEGGIVAFEETEYSVALGGNLLTKKPIVQNIKGNLKYEWSSADENIATVNNGGGVKGIAGGETVITCKATDNDGNVYEASYKLTVTVPIKKITIEQKDVELTEGPFLGSKMTNDVKQYTQQQLTVIIEPADATNQDLVWESSNTKVATVNSKGLVTAGDKPGKATITAKATDGSGKKASVKVTIPKCFLTEKELHFTELDTSLKIGQQYNTGTGFFNMSTKTTGDCFEVGSTGDSFDFNWITIRPTKAGTGTLKFILNGSAVGTVKITVDHSAVYDNVSYPAVKMSVIMTAPEENTGNKTNFKCEVMEVGEPENGHRIIRGKFAEGNDTYYVETALPSKPSFEAGDTVTLYGTLSELKEYKTETGLVYTCVVLEDGHYNKHEIIKKK